MFELVSTMKVEREYVGICVGFCCLGEKSNRGEVVAVS